MNKKYPKEPYIDGAVPTRPLEELSPELAAAQREDIKRINIMKAWIRKQNEIEADAGIRAYLLDQPIDQ